MTTQPIRVYADTSVYGGVFDEEFAVPSAAFFEQVRGGQFRLFTSRAIEEEIEPSPPAVRELFRSMLPLAELAVLSESVLLLRQAYLDAGILGRRGTVDALHVALATLSGCSVLVSWNFKHHVHLGKVPLYNAVNGLLGHAEIAIHSPSGVIRYEEDV